MIRFFLSEEPIIRNVPTRILREPDDLAYTLEHLPELVVKEVHGGDDEALHVAVNVSRSRGPRRKRKKRDWQQ